MHVSGAHGGANYTGISRFASPPPQIKRSLNTQSCGKHGFRKQHRDNAMCMHWFVSSSSLTQRQDIISNSIGQTVCYQLIVVGLLYQSWSMLRASIPTRWTHRGHLSGEKCDNLSWQHGIAPLISPLCAPPFPSYPSTANSASEGKKGKGARIRRRRRLFPRQ